MACGDNDCCEIPVCLKFTHVTATDDFKEEMKDLFNEIFADLCGCGEDCCPDVPIIDGKIAMCLQGHTVNVSPNACRGILNAGGTCGACERPAVEPAIESEV